MRIISKFQDYYDCGQAHGQDPDLMYLRRPDEYILMSGDPWIDRLEDVLDSMPQSYRDPTIEPFIIGFCGKTYPGYKFYWHRMTPHGYRQMERILYHPEDFKTLFLNKALQKKYPNFFKKAKRRMTFWGRRMRFHNAYEVVTQAYKDHFGSEAFFELFLEMNSPIWIYDPATSNILRPRREGAFIKINDSLKPYEFVRIMDPYTAYQEVSMFMGGVLRRDFPVMVPISDASMLKKKGFHDYSFKTRPKENK